MNDIIEHVLEHMMLEEALVYLSGPRENIITLCQFLELQFVLIAIHSNITFTFTNPAGDHIANPN
jgi:hypothetical protein